MCDDDDECRLDTPVFIAAGAAIGVVDDDDDFVASVGGASDGEGEAAVNGVSFLGSSISD